MNLDQIEDLLRRYLSAGIAVVVVLVSPVTGGTAAPSAGEVATAQAGQATAPDGQVDILDGTPPDPRSGDGTTEPAAPGAGPGVEPDPVPDTPGPDASGSEPGAGTAGTGADSTDTDPTGTDADGDAVAGADTGSDADSGADATTGADSTTEDDSRAGSDPGAASDAGTDSDSRADSGSDQPSSAGEPRSTDEPRTTDEPGSTDPGASDPGASDPGASEPGASEPGASDLADRGPADNDEPGVSDGRPRPSDGARSTDGAGDRPGSGSGNDSGANDSGADDSGANDGGAADGEDSTARSGTPTTTPRASGADDQAGEAGNGDADATDPGSAAPTTGAGPADGDGPTGTAATPTTGATPVEAGAAAERYGWGTPVQAEDFTSTRLTGWTPYEGTGYDGRGRRSPEAISVRDGVLTITGDEEGNTGGLCWGGGQRYGRWEARLRAPASDVSYNALLLLWPDADDAPVGGEVDFVEMVDPARRSADFFLHFGEDDDQIRSRVEVDGTAWHDWAVEWTPERIVGYVDGEEWFSSTDPATFPPGPMHLCIQLDWFPQGTGEVRESRMEVDRVAQYALDEAPAGGGGLLDRMLSWS